MAIKILYVDVRDYKLVMNAYLVPWRNGISAKQVVSDALKEDVSGKVIHDLYSDNPEIIVSWHDEKIEQHSEIGGVGDLDWEIPDKSVLTILGCVDISA